MSGRQSFRVDELGDAGYSDPMRTLTVARQLERYADGIEIEAPTDFGDLVMAAVRAEPVPAPARALGVAVRTGRIGPALSALRDAWRVAWSGGRPATARATALALILVLGLALGSLGGGAAVGAWNALHPEHPAIVAPSLSPAPPSVSPSPSPAITPSSTPTPGESDDEPGDSQDHNNDTETAH